MIIHQFCIAHQSISTIIYILIIDMFAQLIWWMVFHHLEDQYYFHFPDFGNTTILCFSSKDHYFLVYWLCNYYYLYWYEKWITWRCQQWRCNAIVPSGSCCGLLVLTTRTLSIRMRRPAGQWRTEVQTLTSLRHKISRWIVQLTHCVVAVVTVVSLHLVSNFLIGRLPPRSETDYPMPPQC